MHPTASVLVTYGIAVLAVLVPMIVALGYGLAGRATGEPPETLRSRMIVALVVADVWLLVTAGLAYTGVLLDFEARPPPLLAVMGLTMLLALGIAISPAGRRLSTLPLWALVGFHTFRLPLELVMHVAATEGTMPPQMSYGGQNLDILSGTTALLLAPLVARGKVPRLVIVLWNAFGLVLLFNIVFIAIASTPVFRAFGDDPARQNTWVAYFPFSWMAVLVGCALIGHVVLTRRLMTERPVAATGAMADR